MVLPYAKDGLVAQIKVTLQQALAPIGNLEQCALLLYPDHPNVGDHLIGLGSINYLTKVAGAAIHYIASAQDFCATALETKLGRAPILLSGGGNLGDLWLREQRFREFIIEQYHDRPIISLPQSLYFADPDNATRAAQVFNAHPNLTLFMREETSYQLALQYFPNCRILKAPDMAFHLDTLPPLSLAPQPQPTLLHHCRQDLERSTFFSFMNETRFPLVTQDWISYEWYYHWCVAENAAWYWNLPGLVTIVREGWQRRLGVPREWVSRWLWQQHPQWGEWGVFRSQAHSAISPAIFQRSLALVHSGFYQFRSHSAVLTNRLHGHILAVLLGIPHIFWPNSYHKNQSFYQTWTHIVPFCQFIEEQTQLSSALEQLILGHSGNHENHPSVARRID
jgi:pyruvyl transferase EpsO